MKQKKLILMLFKKIISKKNDDIIKLNENLPDIKINFENLVNNYLKMNNMFISNIIFNENSIEITIKKNEIESFIEIIKNDNITPNINITCENFEDSLFLNTIFSNIFV